MTAVDYNLTLSNLRSGILLIQSAMNNLGLDGSSSMLTWGTQLNTLRNTIDSLNAAILEDDNNFNDIYNAIVDKGQTPVENDRSTYAPAIENIEIGVELNSHPTSLTYACTMGYTNYSDVLPKDGSWTKYVDLENLQRGVNGLKACFSNNTVVTELDLTGWDFSRQVQAPYMFYGCSNLETIIGEIELSVMTVNTDMFYNCSSLKDLPVVDFGFGSTASSLTLDVHYSNVLDIESLITNMHNNNSGYTRTIEVSQTVYNSITQELFDIAASKNITITYQ